MGFYDLSDFEKGFDVALSGNDDGQPISDAEREHFEVEDTDDFNRGLEEGRKEKRRREYEEEHQLENSSQSNFVIEPNSEIEQLRAEIEELKRRLELANRIPQKQLTPEELGARNQRFYTLATYGSYADKLAVAQNPSASAAVLDQLSKYGSEEHQVAVAQNPSTSEMTLEHLTTYGSTQIKNIIAKRQ